MANITPRTDKSGNIISYQIRVFRGRDASGKRLKDYMMTWKPAPGMTKRQIEKELTRQATLFEENCKLGNVSVERYTFQEYAKYALDVKVRGGMKAKTVSSYRDLLTRINAEIGPLKLQDIRPDHLNRYYAKLAEPGQNKRTGEPLSPKTIREHHRVISSILSLAVKEGLIPTNAAQRATPPKVPKHEMEVFEPEEVQAILKALEDEPMKWRVITTLLIATGARRGEIMGLRWENVDWDNKRLYLCENRVYTKASGTISTTLKTGENRYVSVPASVLDLLKLWQAQQTANCRMLGNEIPAYIATHEDGKLMHPDGITDFLSKFAKRHGLPHIHPHTFRHTMASLLISEGMDVVTVSKRLGHAQTSTTLNVYSHVLAKSDERASDTLDDLIFKSNKSQDEPQSRQSPAFAMPEYRKPQCSKLETLANTGVSLAHLSDHNSKKYQSILQFKKRVIAEEVSSISRVVDAPREIDSFGELAAKRITQAQKHFTPEEIEVLAAEYLEGKSTRELAKQFGCHRETVSRVLKKHGVKVRGRGHQSPI